VLYFLKCFRFISVIFNRTPNITQTEQRYNTSYFKIIAKSFRKQLNYKLSQLMVIFGFFTLHSKELFWHSEWIWCLHLMVPEYRSGGCWREEII